MSDVVYLRKKKEKEKTGRGPRHSRELAGSGEIVVTSSTPCLPCIFMPEAPKKEGRGGEGICRRLQPAMSATVLKLHFASITATALLFHA